MTKFKKLLAILVLLNSSVSLVFGQMDAETVYEYLSKRIDDVLVESRNVKTQMDEMDNKYNRLKLQVVNMNKPSDSLKLQLKTIDSRLNTLEHKMVKMETQFASFEETVARLEGSVETLQRSTRFRKLKTHIEKSINSQASVVIRMIESEKMFLRKSVEHFDKMFEEHKADIQFQVSEIIRTAKTEFESANDSLKATTRDLTEKVHNNSREVESRYKELSADINSKSEDWGLRLGNVEKILKTEIDQTNMQLDLSVKNTREAVSSLSSRFSSVSSSLSSKIASEASSLSSRISSLSERISDEDARKVAFTARLTDANSYYVKNERIDFNDVIYNYGDGYESSSGIFKAPKSGTYLFIFSVQSSSKGKAHVRLKINDYFKAEANANGSNESGSSSVVSYLYAGDKVWIETVHLEDRYYIWSYRTHFTGVLID